MALGNDPELQAEGAPPTGLEGKAGPVVTEGELIFISGAMNLQLRAIDKATGKVLWQTTLPSLNNATARSYMVEKSTSLSRQTLQMRIRRVHLWLLRYHKFFIPIK